MRKKFEQHTRWNNKGKMHKKVELGLPLLVATDPYQFMVHHQVMETETDAELAQYGLNCLLELNLRKIYSLAK